MTKNKKNVVSYNKKDVIDLLYTKIDGSTSKENLSYLVNTFFESVTELLQLEEGEAKDLVKKVVFAGSLIFTSTYTPERKGLNPSTRKTINIPAKRSVRASTGSTMKTNIQQAKKKPKKKK